MNYVTWPWAAAIVFFIAFAIVWLALDNRAATGRADQLEDDVDRDVTNLNERLERAEEWILHLSGRARYLPAIEDEPQAIEEPDTEEIPIGAPTVPDGMPLAVQTALIAEQPHPVDSDDVKAQRAAWVEAQLREIRARIDAAQGAS